MQASELLVGHVTSDVVDDVADDIEDVLIPSYLKTENEGFLTAAYVYNGVTVGGYVCSPADGQWRPVGSFEPSNKVAVAGVGVQDTMRFFNDDRARARAIEDETIDALNQIYDRRVRQTSVVDAQFDAARNHDACPQDKWVETTLTLAQGQANETADPVVCSECMKLQRVIIGGKQTTVPEARQLTDTSDTPLIDEFSLRSATTWDEEVAVATLWYEARRTEQRTVQPTSDEHEVWIIMHNQSAVGYLVWSTEEDTPVLKDVYLTNGARGQGAASAAITRWTDLIGSGDPFLVDMDDDCLEFVSEVAPVENNVIPTYTLARLELGSESYSSS